MGWGVISARSLEVFLMVSYVSVIPKRSMPLLTTRSDRAGALSLIERVLTVPRRRFGAAGARVQANITRKQQERGQTKIQLDVRWQTHSPICTKEKTRNSLQLWWQGSRYYKRILVIVYHGSGRAVNAKPRVTVCWSSGQNEKRTEQQHLHGRVYRNNKNTARY